MEMSHRYMSETAAALAGRGFSLERRSMSLGDAPEGPVTCERFELRRGDAERLTLETVFHPDQTEKYYLQLESWHGLSALTAPLDSWKLWPDRVELKLEAHPDTGFGFALVLRAV